MEWDVPDTTKNRAPFGSGGGDQAAFPKILVVTVSECGSHAPVLAAMGGGHRGGAAMAGDGERPAADPGDADRRVVRVRPHRPEDHRRQAGCADRGCPARRGPG